MATVSLNRIKCIENWLPFRRWFRLASRLDPVQEAAMEERCIVVDENDNPLNSATKKECHLVGPDGNVLLHRAFSVFIFNSKGDLLLQKRSPYKITFPNCYTNACCSHPLHDIEGETEEQNAAGIRRAAQRRLNYELGIPHEEMALDDFKYLTRIHYKAGIDGMWGEHEIDYILVLHRDVSLNPNKNEISDLRYVSRDQFDIFLQTLTAPLSPWFCLIARHRLRLWWDNLNNLQQFQDHNTIYRF